MKLTLVFVTLAEAAATGFWIFENRNHTCHGPKDCDIKCQNKNYTRTVNTITGLNELRCAGSNSDNTYIAAVCRTHISKVDPSYFHNHMSCDHVKGLLCSPHDANFVKKSLLDYCILEPDRYEDWKKFCQLNIQGLEIQSALIGVTLRGVPFDCNPDYLP